MNVLAFDTCFGACSAAILWNGQLTWRYEEMATGQAERLIPMIGEVLDQSGASLRDLDTIAVTEGPGTFTGTRVSVAAARGLALATGLPIRATTSLHVMAYRAISELGEAAAGSVLAVCVDARGGKVFVQVFELQATEPLTQATVMAPDAAAALEAPAPLLCVDSGGLSVSEAARRAGREAEAKLPTLQPDARYLARLAASLPVRDPLVPLYLRPPDAKPQTGKSLPRV